MACIRLAFSTSLALLAAAVAAPVVNPALANCLNSLTMLIMPTVTLAGRSLFNTNVQGSFSMAIYSVSTATDLMNAIKLAQGGDEIRLAPGQYAGVALRGYAPAGNVTITSADPSNPAVFSDLIVSNSSNLTISNVKMVVPNNSLVWYNFQIVGSSNIKVIDSVFDGPGLTPIQPTTGIIIRNSTNVSIDSSEFKNLIFGAAFLDNVGVSVTNSYFHDMGTDGIRGGGNSQVNFSYNFFTNFRPAPGEHADAIQFWTVNTTSGTGDITIKGNVVVRGDNGDPIQGIFIKDELMDKPYNNVNVTDNIIIGGSYNSITLDGVKSGNVTGNSVIAFPDQEGWIRSLNTSDLLGISGNTAFRYVTQFNELTDNMLTPAVTDGGLAALQAWATSHVVPGGFSNWQVPFEVSGLAVPADTGSITAPPPAQPIDPIVNGSDGDDLLVADTTKKVEIHGNGGNDKIIGNGFGAKMLGGTGNDIYDVKGAGDFVQEGAGNGLDWVNSWIDFVLPDNVENLTLKAGGLRGSGNLLDNRLDGSDGVDRLFGFGGSDVVLGGAGNDTLDGGDGNDMLNGGAGVDQLWGGAGIDYFAFDNDALRQTGPDEVMDFERGIDKINVAVIDAQAAAAGDQAFRMIGTKNFSGKAGELQVKAYGDGVLVAGDTNGDRLADFTVWVHGVSKLGTGDFVL